MRVASLIVFLVLVGCGGDDGDVNVGGLGCGTDPCGGDPVGEWSIEATCVTGDFMIEQCPDADSQFAVDLSGSFSIAADMSYSLEVSTSGLVTTRIPGSCLPDQVTDCSDLSNEDISCSGDPSVECDCRQTISQEVTESGTWSTTGNQITFDDTAGGIATNEYCVSGGAMSISTTSDAGITLEALLLQ